MIRQAQILLLLTGLALFGALVAAGELESDQATLKKLRQSEVVDRFHQSAYGYAVFPTIGKGGIGIGAAHGEGRVYRGGKKIGDVTMTQLSIGLQLGGQAYSQVIYFEDERALKEFTTGEFEFGAQAEAIAITASAGAQAGTEGASANANETQAGARYHKGMIVFTMGKGGLMYQASIGGQKYEFKPVN
jgi:lipid-binding SYLF domain-containing protein